MPTVTIRGQGGINTSDFKAVVRALKKAQPAMRRELLRNFRAAGELIARDARAIAGEVSTSIPPTIKTRVRGVGVSVEAGGVAGAKATAAQLFSSGYGAGSGYARKEALAEGVVIAGLFELGNTGGAKSASASRKGVFRHPVFGDTETWVNQPMHPFLVPAGEKNKPAVDAAVYEALDKVTNIIVLEN